MNLKGIGIVLGIWILILSNLNAMKPLTGYPCLPSDFGVIYREVTFKTDDGVNLKGWFYPAQDTSGIANEIIGRMISVPESLKRKPREYVCSKEKKPTIIISGGDAGNMAFSIFYAYHYFTRGYNVFTFDWRGFGESDPWNIPEDQLCCTEFLTDYQAAIDFVKIQPEVHPQKIGVMGFSTGAYLSFAMAAMRDDVSAYIGRALITTIEDLIDNLDAIDSERNFVAPRDYPQDLMPLMAAQNVTIPVFLVVGENDARTPPWMTKAVFHGLSGPRWIWIVPEAEHGGPKGPEMVSYPSFFENTLSFLDQYLK